MKSAVIVFPGLNRDRDMIAALDQVHRPPAADGLADRDGDCPTSISSCCPAAFPMAIICAAAPSRRARRSWRRSPNRPAAACMVLGVCNGFQILVEAGLLPGALMRNASLQFRLPRVELTVENDNTVFTRGFARASHPPRRSRMTTAIISPIRRRWPHSKAKAGWCSAMPTAPTPMARSTTLPASSTETAPSSASCRIPKT